MDDRLAEGLALVGVLQGVLVGGAGDADGLRGDRGPGGLERGHGRLLAAVLGLARVVQRLAGPGQLLVELVLAAEQARAGDPHVVEHDLGGVRGADAHLRVLLALRQAGRAGRHDEAGLTAALQLGIDGGDHHVDVGDAAVGDPRLGAVEHPLVLGLVVDGLGAQRRDVGTGVGLAHAERAELHVSGVP